MREEENSRVGTVLTDLVHEGVAVWLDGVNRQSLEDGSLRRRAMNACVSGAVLSLRELAREVQEGTAYQDQIDLLGERGVSAEEAVRALHSYDARWACDVLRPVFASTGEVDGWVSAELDPRLADDARASIAAARALALGVNRPNLLVKVPSTVSGLEVLSGCVAEGIGVDTGPLYSVQRYNEVVEAYFDGLERAFAAGRSPGGSSVASFSAARLEDAVDAQLDEAAEDAAAVLRGRSAPALAQAAYTVYEDWLGTERWRQLRARGARPQRLVWLSATAPGPEAASVRRVEELVAWGTIHALPEPTLSAVDRLGRLRGDTLSGESDASDAVLSALRQQGINMEQLAEDLTATELREGVHDQLELIGTLQARWSGRPHR
ncbi:transaldolase family protein [Streptomyces gilvosporeus]|uniref:transaldolase family protein n=1 Tax=Streptomyces gilvosporeus TaxID=553510 RepID=UPI00131AC3C4|nr:transaldolase family protein [Streptomyces gilvosporeus]